MEHVLRTDSGHADFKALVALLNADLKQRDGEEHSFYAQFNGIEKLKQAVILYADEIPMACGAIKAFDANTVEVKRMYVLPQYRGKGWASKVLRTLEDWAKELGYTNCVLETGLRQPEAIALYKKNGYGTIANYPPYEHMANSVCFKKAL